MNSRGKCVTDPSGFGRVCAGCPATGAALCFLLQFLSTALHFHKSPRLFQYIRAKFTVRIGRVARPEFTKGVDEPSDVSRPVIASTPRPSLCSGRATRRFCCPCTNLFRVAVVALTLFVDRVGS